ncbi:SusC/RagA family TonB-linked outer membrane protein [Ohtaekwangia koreensis]|uniref:TonB-linked outer membrane protein, SusC/RagA family n=1 Tax=Ohtaekwangia koreensis TaxID=688867 RepID=A0A1T5KHX0_9BACT|nr:TonB-dependent receptor [Ohtaekwangia koreensis]SKC63344.1 TonB-linked outer membrane protein, SusC/RagA family [Ohtaekwangia koreensis]
MKIKLLLSFCLWLLTFLANGQTTVSGTVKDDTGQALPGVNIIVKGTSLGTTSDTEGKYAIAVPADGVLLFSFIGYKSQEVSIGDRTGVDVVLSPEVTSLDEVVVVGYGTQKRSNLSGSVAKLSAESYKDQPLLNTSSALQGRVAGVSVSNYSGAPGGAVKIRIRGANSITADNEPLYVVDGVALAGVGLSEINVNDIESMEVLKDATATAIYGSRGSNGVILITTKNGKTGAPKVEYNGFVSVVDPMKQYDLMDAQTYARIANLTSGAAVFADPGSFAGKSTNWQKEIFDRAITQSHQISLSGGSPDVKYFISGFTVNQNGVLLNTSQRKFGLRTNLQTNINKWISLGLNLYGARLNSHNNTDTGGKGNPVMSALTWAPTEPVMKDGTYNRFGISPIWSNPYMTIKERLSDNFSNVGVFNANLRFDLTDYLTFTTTAALNMNISKLAYLNNDYISSGNPGAGQSSSQSYTFQTDNILEFHKMFGQHDVTATAVVESTSNKAETFAAQGSGLATTSNGYNNLALNNTQSIASTYSNWALLSFVGRVQYAFNDKYLFTAAMRRDGSSKFQGANKWSMFPSVSAGWKLSNEAFVQNLDAFSNLKLRGGWGVTGNQAINPYGTLGLLAATTYSYGTNTLYPAYTIGNPSNPDLKWETTRQTNIGLDIGLLKGRINITADYYDKNTTDLLLATRIANYDGGGSLLKNVGKVNNKGLELAVEGVIIQTNDLRWSAAVNYFTNRNKVINLGPDSLVQRGTWGGGLMSAPIQVLQVGQPMSSFYLIPWEGVYQNESGVYKAGDARYTDTSGNGTIGLEDRIIVGSAIPKFQFGFNNTVTYKKFSLNLFIQGVYGNKIFNATYAATAVPTSDVKYPTLAEAADYWTPANTSSTWANPGSTNKSWVESTQFLQDGSYARLKNVSLSYQVDKSHLKFLSAKVYVSAQNLFTITNYKGFDPEASSTGSTSDSDGGIDLGAYPSARTYTLGAVLTF